MARLLCGDLDLQLLVPLGRLRGVVGADNGAGEVEGGGWLRRVGGGVGDGGGGGGGGVGVVAAAAPPGGGGVVVGGVRGGGGRDGDGGESAADTGDEGAVLMAAELWVVDAEGVGDVLGGGAAAG